MSGLPDRFDKAEKEFTHRKQPRLSIYQSEGGHINAAAVRQLWDTQPEALFIGADPEANELGFVPANRDAPDSYVFSSDDQGKGGDIRFGTTLEVLGINPDTFDDTQYLDLECDGDLVVADMTPLLESDDGDDVDTTPGEDSTVAMPDDPNRPEPGPNDTLDTPDGSGNTPDVDLGDKSLSDQVAAYLDGVIGPGGSVETTCGAIGDAIGADGRGVVHALKSLDGFEVERTDKTDDSGASVWRVSNPSAATTKTVEDALRDSADRVDTVQELADHVDVSEERARAFAHDHDVDLEDRPPRPGVDR